MPLSDSLISSFEVVWRWAHKIPLGALPVCIKYLYNIRGDPLTWDNFPVSAMINLELFKQGNKVAERDLMFGDDCTPTDAPCPCMMHLCLFLPAHILVCSRLYWGHPAPFQTKNTGSTSEYRVPKLSIKRFWCVSLSVKMSCGHSVFPLQSCSLLCRPYSEETKLSLKPLSSSKAVVYTSLLIRHLLLYISGDWQA